LSAPLKPSAGEARGRPAGGSDSSTMLPNLDCPAVAWSCGTDVIVGQCQLCLSCIVLFLLKGGLCIVHHGGSGAGSWG